VVCRYAFRLIQPVQHFARCVSCELSDKIIDRLPRVILVVCFCDRLYVFPSYYRLVLLWCEHAMHSFIDCGVFRCGLGHLDILLITQSKRHHVLLLYLFRQMWLLVLEVTTNFEGLTRMLAWCYWNGKSHLLLTHLDLGWSWFGCRVAGGSIFATFGSISMLCRITILTYL